MMPFAFSFDAQRQAASPEEKRRGTAHAHRDKALQMLAPDLIDKDPKVRQPMAVPVSYGVSMRTLLTNQI